ncbi:MAG TPA: SDR family oxidoreductase, partial [Bacillota bacterium]|nr:SDR family oxidoreductase [Bacillota bacterium]
SRFTPETRSNLFDKVEATDFSRLEQIISDLRPDQIINCMGIIKQIQNARSELELFTVNTLLPHRLAYWSRPTHTRVIHISTDCVFDGRQGNYGETDPPSPVDLYGVSKYLGELEYPHCLTLRTSIIGHELRGNYGLLEWFLAQTGTVNGYTQAIYSGLPTIELAEVIERYVIPNLVLHGIFHVAAEPITKYELLRLIKDAYGSSALIIPSDCPVINRSLDSTRFRRLTGYQPPAWPILVEKMYRDYQTAGYLSKSPVKE